jgi:pimeloyl-ACP methyl ester carboxylesterase
MTDTPDEANLRRDALDPVLGPELRAHGKVASESERAAEIDPLPDLQQYGGPILSITGSNSDEASPLHKLVPRMQHQRIGGTSHWIHMDKPGEFNRMLDSFLASLAIPLSVP